MAYLVVVLAMLALGRWQLARADEKIALLGNASRARAAPAVALDRIDDVAEAAGAYRRVRVEGRWEGDHQLLWDNRAHAGRAGYEVITPLRLGDGRLALVNRGWLAPGPTREMLPDVALPATASGDAVAFDGLLSRPSKGFASGAALAASGPWPRVLQYFDYAAIESALGEPIVPAVVQSQVATDGDVFADARAASASRADGAGADGAGADGGGPDAASAGTPPVDAPLPAPPATPEAVGSGAGTAVLLTPNWRPAASGPEKHYGYAFQWFAMATALTAIFVVVNLSRNETDEPELPPAR